jgi:hypothetical protein
MNNAAGVDVVEGATNSDCKSNGPGRVKALFPCEQEAERRTLQPFHDETDPPALLHGKDSQHSGVIHGSANPGFPLKACKQRGVALGRRVGNLYSDLCTRPKIGGSKDGGHTSIGNTFIQAVMVQSITNLKGSHAKSLRAKI